VKESRESTHRLTRSKHKDIRAAAILSLGELGAEQSAPLLVDLASDKGYEWDDRTSAIVLIPKVAGKETETYVLKTIAADRRLETVAREVLAKYRTSMTTKKDLKPKGLSVSPAKDETFLLSWDRIESCIGYVVQVRQETKAVATFFSPSEKGLQLKLPQGTFQFRVRCIVPNGKYLAPFKGPIARVSAGFAETKAEVSKSEHKHISVAGNQPEASLAAILGNSGNFLDKIVFLAGVSDPNPEADPMWGPITRQDWVLTQGKHAVFITGSDSWDRYYVKKENRLAGRPVAVVGQVKRLAAGGCAIVSLQDWESN